MLPRIVFPQGKTGSTSHTGDSGSRNDLDRGNGFMDLITKIKDTFSNSRSCKGALISLRLMTQPICEATSFFKEDCKLSERVYYLLGNKIGECKICGKDTYFVNFNKGYLAHCSSKCAGVDKDVRDRYKQTCLKSYGVDNSFKFDEIKNKIKVTNLGRYGVESPIQNEEIKNKIKTTNIERYGVSAPAQNKDIQEKQKHTCLERYGVEFPAQNKEIYEKVKQTNLDRYGVACSSQTEFAKKKQKQTCLEKYGVKSPLQNKEIRDKQKQTCIERYGVEHSAQNKEIRIKMGEGRKIKFYENLLASDRLKGMVKPLFSVEDYQRVAFNYKFQCINCESIFKDHLDNGRIPRCFKCFPKQKGVSKYDQEISDWLLSLGIQNVSKGDRSVLSPLELDIFLPDYNLALEFNGLYWHSELQGKDKKYHLNKTKVCQEKGIQLLHIFEDEWIEKQEIVKSIIKSKLGLIENKVFARNCEIREVSNEDALRFLFDNHLQESVNCKHNYGLYSGNELVYLVCLSKPRFNKNYQFELVRSCPKINTSIVGGFSKLIKFIVEKLEIKSLISYVDKRYFDGKGYKDWTLLNETSPNYFYMKDYRNRESRMKFQKHKIAETEEDKNLTEWQLMQLKGYDRIWDCGNLTFERRVG